jgi:hypothetical protein
MSVISQKNILTPVLKRILIIVALDQERERTGADRILPDPVT